MLRSLLAASSMALMMMTIPMAASAEGPTLGVTAGLNSNYVWRGVTLSDNEPQLYVEAVVEVGNAYGGTYITSTDFGDNDPASLEIDLFGGYVFGVTERLALDVGGIYYGYPDSAPEDAANGAEYDWTEVYVKPSYIVSDSVSLNGEVAYTPSGFLGSGEQVHLAAGFEWDTLDVGFIDLGLSGTVGQQQFKDISGAGYEYVQVSLTGGIKPLGLDTHLTFSTADGFEDQVVVGASFSF